jgi:membrane protein
MVWRLTKRAAIKWYEDDCLTLGAALAYYTVFSLAPVLVIAIAVAGALFGREAAQGEIVGQIRGLVGEEGATAIQSLIESAGRQDAGGLATLIGLVVLLFGSTSAFSQLQAALNRIWEVPPQARAGLWDVTRARFLSFAAVLGMGFLLSVSLVLSAAVAAFGRFGRGWVPEISSLLELADFLGTMLVHTLLFAMIFKLLPDAPIRWRHVWLGAGVTAGLFFVGKLVIGLYLGTSEVGAAYGAAGWVILILAWVYYSAQIVLFGAEFTRAYALQGRPSSPPLPSRERTTSRRFRRPPS